MRYFIIFLLFVMSSFVSAADFQEGQVWKYKARFGEGDSTITILKVENYKDLGCVVHLRVDKIQIRNTVRGNMITDIPHLPFKEDAVRQSVTKLVRRFPAVPDFKEGYDTWKQAYLAGQAGAFDTTVSKTLDAMIGAKWEEKK